jgi:hypothetical protein
VATQRIVEGDDARFGQHHDPCAARLAVRVLYLPDVRHC